VLENGGRPSRDLGKSQSGDGTCPYRSRPFFTARALLPRWMSRVSFNLSSPVIHISARIGSVTGAAEYAGTIKRTPIERKARPHGEPPGVAGFCPTRRPMMVFHSRVFMAASLVLRSTGSFAVPAARQLTGAQCIIRVIPNAPPPRFSTPRTHYSTMAAKRRFYPPWSA